MSNFMEMLKTKEDHYKLMVNGTDAFGEQERSVWRQIISTIDDKIHKY